MTLTLTAINKTRHEAVLYYIADDADPVPYATLPPGGRQLQETFVGHRWRLQTTDEDALASAELCMPSDAATLLLDHGNRPQVGEHQRLRARVSVLGSA